MSSDQDIQGISRQAEKDLNSYQAKTGNNRSSSSDEAGVDTSVEKRFPGAEVKAGDDLVTNAGYDRKIPQDEGGDPDSRGRTPKGSRFEGQGGPEDKFAARAEMFGGENDNDVPTNKEDQGMGQRTANILSEGAEASRANVGSNPKIGGGKFKGDDYYTPETVEDSIASQGNVPPDSAIEASKDSEQT